MERDIIHLNIADFAFAVEATTQPSLKDRPVIVAPTGAPRAVVYDMSEAAFRQGIRKGMPLAKAKRLNKNIKVLPPSFIRYEKAMKALLKEGFAFTPFIESGRADGHIFMDVTKSSRLFGPPVDMAFRLKKFFSKNFGLDPVWSVGTSKLITKVATRLVKPDGEYIVPSGEEKAFLAPLPLKLIPGIRKRDIAMLHDFNLFKVRQARALTREQLAIPFDNRALMVYKHLRGIDAESVAGFNETSCVICADHEFNTDTNDKTMIKKALYLVVEKACAALRQQKMHAGTALLALSYSDGFRQQGKIKLKQTAPYDMILFKQCKPLLFRVWKRRVRIRHIQLICEKCPARPDQALMFEKTTREERQARLVTTMDKVRARFGKSAVRTGLSFAK